MTPPLDARAPPLEARAAGAGDFGHARGKIRAKRRAELICKLIITCCILFECNFKRSEQVVGELIFPEHTSRADCKSD